MGKNQKTLLGIFLIVVLTAVIFVFRQDQNSLTAAYSNTDQNEILVAMPQPGARIRSPLSIKGQARGTWYFEASAPITLTDWDGRIIAERYITAQSDWMTENFVPFEGTLEFEKPAYGERGFLILRADNPSGLPAYDRSIEIPIFFE